MKTILVLGCMLATGLALSGCQSPQARQAELARICSDPVNRQPGNFYAVECQSLYPLTSRQRQQQYFAGAPTGD